MPSPKKIAFCTALTSVYMHRLARGILSFAETTDGVVVREFKVTRNVQPQPDGKDALSALLAWKPDGIASFLEESNLQIVLSLMDPPCPVISMCHVTSKPGINMVLGSFLSVLQAAIKHFRQLGLRSISMVILEPYDPKIERLFLEVAQLQVSYKPVHTEIIDPSILENPENPITEVPQSLTSWLTQLPKPCGIFTPQMGGGSYITQVCDRLGLRIPEDIAIIGMDDTDTCLATQPTLTSIIPCGEKIGYEAAKILVNIINGAKPPEKSVIFDALDLRVRQSTGQVKARLCDIATAMSYINQHACTGLTVDELIHATQQVSYKTFHTHFKESTGMTPGEAIQQRQIEEACRLLAGTKLSLTLIAEKCGFGSSSDFARRFRVCRGCSPSEFRKNHAAA